MCVVVLLSLVVSSFIGMFKDDLFVKYNLIRDKALSIKNVMSNQSRIQFVNLHHFYGDQVDFNAFIKKTSDRDHARILEIKQIEDECVDKIRKQTYEISEIFWHDSFVFDFLDAIQDFNPGFANIKLVEITKCGRASKHKPAIKVRIVCDIFQK